MARPTNIGGLAYTPSPVPDDPADLPRYLREEFDRIASSLSLMNQGFREVVYVAPAKPRVGQIIVADGTSLNPGSGAGAYRYTAGGTWAFLG
jgi:hypothetical protein